MALWLRRLLSNSRHIVYIPEDARAQLRRPLGKLIEARSLCLVEFFVRGKTEEMSGAVPARRGFGVIVEGRLWTAAHLVEETASVSFELRFPGGSKRAFEFRPESFFLRVEPLDAQFLRCGYSRALFIESSSFAVAGEGLDVAFAQVGWRGLPRRILRDEGRYAAFDRACLFWFNEEGRQLVVGRGRFKSDHRVAVPLGAGEKIVFDPSGILRRGSSGSPVFVQDGGDAWRLVGIAVRIAPWIGCGVVASLPIA